MNILVTYDVNTEDRVGQRRLYRVAKICQNYGRRVQNSVFECVLTEVQLLNLKAEIEEIIEKTDDSVRIYYLSKNDAKRVVVLGRDNSINVEGFLMI